ncbi:hypothetical protein H6G06_09355 [Anabaena sphaerica FACHB-251]|uniref:Uncharacterized protein n=1 Tax=Anabaena sphaerica FACHB-251 TaxID=2692883 RepID=A0A927A1P0_9NOST|nr:hypothetical protein [Anabaena sphaerica]MBD2293690.1 hypothetical protein [Anabaena sphaerica FACHB-251]
MVFCTFLLKPFAEHTIFDALAIHLGVKYIFALTNSSNCDVIGEIPLISAHLNDMSQKWINKLYKAALDAHTYFVIKLIEEITKRETRLIQTLIKIAHQFEFEQLVYLAKPRISND